MVNLSETPGNSDLLIVETNYYYRVSCRHLKGGAADFPLRLYQEYSDPTGVLDEKTCLERIQLTVDGEPLTAGFSTKRVSHEGMDSISVTFDKTISVVGEATINVKTQAQSLREDNTEIIYARYPTRGFRAMLNYRDDMRYDVAWLRPWAGKIEDLYGRDAWMRSNSVLVPKRTANAKLDAEGAWLNSNGSGAEMPSPLLPPRPILRDLG
jgi:hypothetical protein